MAKEAPILGKKGISEAQKRTNNVRAILTIILMVTFFGSMIASVTSIADFLEHHPELRFLFPLLGAGSVLLIIPLGVYLTNQGDFPDVNPIIPSHYFRLARRCFVAMVENDGKVSGKDL
ncbi:hypothetical protein COCSUDRAFT_32248 [Coccomyxa subellipsoidea C-169]|uniref:Uncharacterized protein n=1 Tax=Coccomyxa subellipsoidea (strain C-169) TaxID=574566 RepID=I0Z7T4_COCSC|nr:hypothetical protein COCSUDRAFT_32248 [Coccomyxa subellipsoidea C-169]EIE26703.1 hypothetical protein COCSUDRAFT_32248 [Coccomyxa subellipsoidea C-169]|eukprot:XP_005651247.1 hypothetical protein COCSUDRAFT_32248 [Coccomyxa subellipsoidea C-169]